MQKKGFTRFESHQHTQLWKAENAKNPTKGFGVQIANTWYWYDVWLEHVLNHCESHADMYR